MAAVRVRIDDFEDGVLPGVCASSGAAGARLYRIDVSTRTPGWLWLCVFGGPAGIVVGLVLSGVLRKSATGYVPYTEDVHATLRERRRTYSWFLIGGLAAVVGGLALSLVDGYAALGVVLMVGGFFLAAFFGFLWSNVPGSVGGTLDSTARWVVLDPVSARFAEDYEAQEADRRRARRDEVIGTRLDR